MGQHQAGMLKTQLLPEEDIKIQRARSPALFMSPITTPLTFQAMQLLQQRQRAVGSWGAKVTRRQHHGIAITRLIWRTANGCSVEQGRPGVSDPWIAAITRSRDAIKASIRPSS
jgi:hypothetical protein